MSRASGPAQAPVVMTAGTADQMRQVGRRIAALLGPGDLLILTGGLGAGKTTFTQGLGAGLGVRGAVTSPTFVISRVHPSLGDGPPLVHVDAYRLGGGAELDDLDLDAVLDAAVTVVEWGEGVAESLAEDRLEITITAAITAAADADPSAADGVARGAGEGDQPRTIAVRGHGARWANVDLQALLGSPGSSRD